MHMSTSSSLITVSKSAIKRMATLQVYGGTVCVPFVFKVAGLPNIADLFMKYVY